MHRLSGLDASFLYLETPAQLMHVCGLIVLDPRTMPEPYDFELFRDELDERVRDVPTFVRMLKHVPLGLDHPVWVRDPHFDIEHHVHRMALPRPGGHDELMKLAGHLAGLPLDRGRPLWEMWVIEGYEPEGEERIVVFSKMHHATVDGVSGANLISHLCSLEPDAPPEPLEDEPPLTDAPSELELVGRAVLSTVTRPFNIVRLAASSAQLVVRSIDRAREGTAMAAPFTAPRTLFNGTISGHRSVGIADMDLGLIKELKSATGTTVNDVVLTVAGGALRSYLQEHDTLPSQSLLATVPVSVRSESKADGGANKVSALFTKLGTDEPDPLTRLRAMAERNLHAKEHHKAVNADTLQDWAEFAAPRTFGLAVRAYARLRLAEKHPVVHNLVISNVPGPPVPVYFLGAEIVGLYPLGPVFHGAGLNITVMSNNGSVNVGVIASSESLEDPGELAALFQVELDRLRRAAEDAGLLEPARSPRPRPRRGRD